MRGLLAKTLPASKASLKNSKNIFRSMRLFAIFNGKNDQTFPSNVPEKNGVSFSSVSISGFTKSCALNSNPIKIDVTV